MRQRQCMREIIIVVVAGGDKNGRRHGGRRCTMRWQCCREETLTIDFVKDNIVGGEVIP